MRTLLCVVLIATSGLSAFAQSADPTLLAEIMRMKAIDNHAHPMNTDPDDQEFDAIACGGLEFVSPPPLRLRLDNQIYVDAWRALYGTSTSSEALTAKRTGKATRGDDYPAWVLDQLNIETMLTNRTSKGRGLNAPRFRWVGYGDPLMLPLSTKALGEADSDKNFLYKRERRLLEISYRVNRNDERRRYHA